MEHQHITELRRSAVAQALANLWARGVLPKPAVVALYECYSTGVLNWQEVQRTMRERAAALLSHRQRPLRQGCGPGAPTSCPPLASPAPGLVSAGEFPAAS